MARHRRSSLPRRVALPSGDDVVLRRLRPDDEELLARAYDALSERSRRRRFLAAPPRLSEEDLRHLVAVDDRRLVAVLALDPADREPVGEARYVLVPGDPGTAEVGVFVVDSWQHRGLGWLLFAEIVAQARERGVRRFVAAVTPDNELVLDATDQLPVRRLPSRGSELEFELDLRDLEALEDERSKRRASASRSA